MQVGGFPPDEHRHDDSGVIERINLLAERLRSRGQPVIFVQHDGSAEGRFIPGSPEWALLPALHVADGDIVIAKTANDAFYSTQLASILDTVGAREVIVTGWATDFCVDATVRSAMSHDYDVVVVADGHTVGDRPDLTAKQVVEYHNWLWPGLTPTLGRVRVLPCDKLLIEDLS